MRIMLRTWLRVSEYLSLCPADPPIISLRPQVTGNKVKRGREVHIPDDLVECLECLEDLVLKVVAHSVQHRFGGSWLVRGTWLGTASKWAWVERVSHPAT